MRPVGRGVPLGTVFRSVGGAQHYHMDPRPPDPRRPALHLTCSRVVGDPLPRSFRLFVPFLIPKRFWDLFIGDINRDVQSTSGNAE